MALPASSNYDWIELNAAAASATAYGPFVLAGGTYAYTAVMGSTSTIDFAILGPDGSTKVDVVAQLKGSTATTAFGTTPLPPGTYYVTIGTAAASFAVQRVRGP